MRMHAVRADERSRRFVGDVSANLASAALPLVLGALGMGLLAVGALLTLIPLVFTGVGLAVVGFAAYLIASRMDRVDAKKAVSARQRAAEARDAFRSDVQEMAPRPPRSPLADHAVAALSGEGGAGIWPPLPSRQEGMFMMDGGKQPVAAKTQRPVTMWGPGEKAMPAGWEQEEVVEFAEVPEGPQRVMATPGGVSYVEGAPSGAQMARADPVTEERDFRVWPGAKNMDSWTTFTGERRPQTSRYTEEQLKDAMEARRRQIAGRLPTVGAILADVAMKETEMERLRREATRGKCSKCESIIWAPKKRPIILKCPGCGHKAKLY